MDPRAPFVFETRSTDTGNELERRTVAYSTFVRTGGHVERGDLLLLLAVQAASSGGDNPGPVDGLHLLAGPAVGQRVRRGHYAQQGGEFRRAGGASPVADHGGRAPGHSGYRAAVLAHTQERAAMSLARGLAVRVYGLLFRLLIAFVVSADEPEKEQDIVDGEEDGRFLSRDFHG